MNENAVQDGSDIVADDDVTGVNGAMKKRSVVIAGHRTSISLEDAFWLELKRLAADANVTVNHLVTEIDRNRAGNLSSAIRVHILRSLRAS